MPKPRGIPAPQPTSEALMQTVSPMKEILEEMTGQLGDPLDRVVTYRDLVSLGLITKSRVPR